ncbi:molybdenum ABC transporter ATP-binding protein ModC [Vibrio sp. SS-MA-C1-2]|uniref:molybdenum ABC transporter ATP-binding protein ModC n=1 Tax=Vibrio sp. SS-MA-C1-2 TaxID=2908646 RepID=UPI001F23A775|nr:molybdenum ABC transporter ATP-binding protein ModC [Vibrio sp. SS-MA-C1-2]UJF17502.1 molybdenum ABC transporter ATP-binding protein ModC [Vibrio sp. SS-MA-C1-2]
MLQVAIQKQLGQLLLDIDCQFPSSGITAIFGRSGAGKTSFVNQLSGLSRPDKGLLAIDDKIYFDSEKRIFLPPEQRQIGYVFQDARLFPHYTVKGNLKYGSKKHQPELFQQVVALLGLSDLLNRYPSSLSGGEKQRVAIGRALLSQPRLLLMDEPLASLDLPRKRELLPYLEQLANEFSIPIVYVTHSLQEILRLADHLVVLDAGRVVASGELATVWSSAEMRPWLEGYEQSSMITAQLIGHHPKYAMSQLAISNHSSLWVSALEKVVGESVRVRIRASDVSIVLHRPEGTSIRNILSATITQLIDAKENSQLQLKIGDNFIWATLTNWAVDELGLKVGDEVFAQIKGVSVSQEDMG